MVEIKPTTEQSHNVQGGTRPDGTLTDLSKPLLPNFSRQRTRFPYSFRMTACELEGGIATGRFRFSPDLMKDMNAITPENLPKLPWQIDS